MQVQLCTNPMHLAQFLYVILYVIHTIYNIFMIVMINVFYMGTSLSHLHITTCILCEFSPKSDPIPSNKKHLLFQLK